MSALTTELEVPAVLPVKSLSVSSIMRFLRCPESWRRTYLEGEWEPVGPPLLLGKAVGAAESTSLALKVQTGSDLSLDDVQDAYSDEWDLAVETASDREGIEWSDKQPAVVKEVGREVLAAYHTTVAPSVKPVSVEREFRLQPPGADWVYKGYIDIEDADDVVIDMKVKGKALSASDARVDAQATSYLLARRQEARAGFGKPARRFDFHVMKTLKTPVVDIVDTTRTDVQLDAFYQRILRTAQEIAWRAEMDVWQGAVPGSWWCGPKFCGFWDRCPMGGKA
jgi:hypothetical protein